eukprot:GHVT01051285.1.p1 GENE.GHVT01051285.1~~GHVT01051285.1.p1  ORF type:complete len:259 (-),score=42.90 GHVT01051285.1:1947-2723(-)
MRLRHHHHAHGRRWRTSLEECVGVAPPESPPPSQEHPDAPREHAATLQPLQQHQKLKQKVLVEIRSTSAACLTQANGKTKHDPRQTQEGPEASRSDTHAIKQRNKTTPAPGKDDANDYAEKRNAKQRPQNKIGVANKSKTTGEGQGNESVIQTNTTNIKGRNTKVQACALPPRPMGTNQQEAPWVAWEGRDRVSRSVGSGVESVPRTGALHAKSRHRRRSEMGGASPETVKKIPRRGPAPPAAAAAKKSGKLTGRRPC